MAGSRAAPPSRPELSPYIPQAHRAGTGVEYPSSPVHSQAGVPEQCHISAVLARCRDPSPCGEGALATLEHGEPVLALGACSTAA